MVAPSDTSAVPPREESDLAIPLRSGGERGKAAGNGYVTKPINPDDLGAAIARVLKFDKVRVRR